MRKSNQLQPKKTIVRSLICICLAALLLPVISLAEDGHNTREIAVIDIGPVCIGQTENAEAATGCTVFIAPDGMRAGLDVRGGGPASRESQLPDPLAAARQIHAIVFPAVPDLQK